MEQSIWISPRWRKPENEDVEDVKTFAAAATKLQHLLFFSLIVSNDKHIYKSLSIYEYDQYLYT